MKNPVYTSNKVKKSPLLAAVLCLSLSPIATFAQRTLVWEENFNTTTLNTQTWTYETGDGCSKGNCGWGNAELEYYTNRTENVRIENGHLVIEASDGVKAVDAYRQAYPRPNLVILDLDMPVLTGEETQDRLLKVDPGARILFVSGHDEPSREAAVHARGALGFLRKPCKVNVLLGAVSDALGSQEDLAQHEERTRPV